MSVRANIPLSDFITLQRGFDLPTARRKEGGVPVIASTGIAGYHNEAKVRGPGVVIGRSGSIGGGQYIVNDFWPLNTTLWVKDFKGNNPRFTYYLLRSIDFTRFNAGAGVPTLNRNHIASFRVPRFNPVEQARSASILSAYDDLIENNRRRIQLLEQAAWLLYKEWFIHLRFPGHEHVTITDGVPEGWTQGVIGDLGKVVTGKTPSKKRNSYYGDDIPFIKTPDMHGNTIIIETGESLTEEGANSQTNKTLPPRSILVSCIGTVGAVSLNATTAQTNQQINAIIPSTDSLRYWLFFMARTLKPLLEGMGGGATMANVNKSKFSSIPVVIPSQLMLAQFNSVATSSIDQIEKLALMNLQLTKARDILLPRLMNGEVAV